MRKLHDRLNQKRQSEIVPDGRCWRLECVGQVFARWLLGGKRSLCWSFPNAESRTSARHWSLRPLQPSNRSRRWRNHGTATVLPVIGIQVLLCYCYEGLEKYETIVEGATSKINITVEQQRIRENNKVG